ncbi:MAG: OsmC family protein [Cytophagales bacterium]|nr:OsmC family protein [Cytophagales bacterium]
MKVSLKRLNNATHLEASNEFGNKISIDGSAEIGGQDLGFRPMQLVLAGLGSCSTMDIISILAKQKEPLRHIEIEVTGKRADAVPAVFTDIHVQFKLYGPVSSEKAERAIILSMTKYCSVTKMLEPTVNITHGFEILE